MKITSYKCVKHYLYLYICKTILTEHIDIVKHTLYIIELLKFCRNTSIPNFSFYYTNTSVLYYKLKMIFHLFL